MNYYEHHLGDYLRDTAHLSMLEDAAYRRLLDSYYIRERPLPLDHRECCKLARAVSKPERDAVAYVLREFFWKTDDGYHQKRADVEIGRFQDKQRKAKASADARWNAQRTLSDGNANAHADASSDAMRTHSEGNAPRARPQSPDTSQKQSPEAARIEPKQPPEPEPSQPRRGAVAMLLRGLGVTCTYAHPQVVEWAQQGVTDEQLSEAVQVARMHKPEPAPIPVAYLAPIVAEIRNPTPPVGAAHAASRRGSPTATERNIATLRGLTSGSAPGDAIDGTAERVG